MTNGLSVSVVIPCHNAAEFLPAAIESALAQTRAVREIIVVDDGSTDGSREVAARYPIKVLETPARAGTAAARNVGVRHASGDVVAALDADDVWMPNHCQTVVSLLERYPDAAVACSPMRFVGLRSGEWRPPFPAGKPRTVFWASVDECVVPHSTAVMHRRLILDLGGYREHGLPAATDYDLWLRLAATGALFVRASNATALYRWHGSQISSRPLAQIEGVYRARSDLWRTLLGRGQNHLARRLAHHIEGLWHRDMLGAWDETNLPVANVLRRVRRESPIFKPKARLRWELAWRFRHPLRAVWRSMPPAVRNLFRPIYRPDAA